MSYEQQGTEHSQQLATFGYTCSWLPTHSPTGSSGSSCAAIHRKESIAFLQREWSLCVFRLALLQVKSFQVWQQQGASCNPPAGAQCQAQAASLVILLLNSSWVILLWKAGCSNGCSFYLLTILLGPVSLTTTYISDMQMQAHAESIQEEWIVWKGL